MFVEVFSVNDIDDLVGDIYDVQEKVERLQKAAPNRELALVITKLDEARHWLSDLVANMESSREGLEINNG